MKESMISFWILATLIVIVSLYGILLVINIKKIIFPILKIGCIVTALIILTLVILCEAGIIKSLMISIETEPFMILNINIVHILIIINLTMTFGLWRKEGAYLKKRKELDISIEQIGQPPSTPL